jgi:hypothetical protein
MTITVYPADAVSGTPNYSGRMLRQTMAVAFAGASAARPLGARSGVRPGTPSSTVTATSTTWTVQPHAGLLDLETALQASAYAYSSDAAVTGTMTAANATNPRVDVIWVTVNDAAESDGTSASTPPNVAFGYSAGTAAASPVAPGVGQGSPAVPTRSMIIAQINVPVSGGGSPTVTWIAPYCAAAGAPRLVNTLSQAGTGMYNGEPIMTLDTGIPYWWYATGGAWYTKPVQPPMACRYYCSAAMNLTNGGRTQLTLGGKSFDYSPGGNLVSSNAFTATEAGLYDVRWRVSANINNNPQDFYSLIASSGFGTEYSYGNRVDVRSGTSADTWASGGADLVPLAVGGTIILAANNPGANIMVVTTGTTNTFLSIVKVD